MRSPLLVCLLVAAPAAAADLPPDLALVPPDAVGFAHLRLADLRAAIWRADPAAVAALDAQFVPKPSTLDRVTLIVLPAADGGREPEAVAVLRFREPFDPAAVRKSALPGGKPHKFGGKEVVADADGDPAAYFPDDRTVVLSDLKGLTLFLTRTPAAAGDAGLAAAVAGAAGRPATVAVDLSRLPLPPAADVPPPFRPLLKARLATATVAAGPTVRVEARAAFPTAADATAAATAVGQALGTARAGLAQPRQQLEQKLGRRAPGAPPRPLAELPEAAAAAVGLGWLATVDGLLADPPLTRNGAVLAAAADVPSDLGLTAGSTAVLVGLLVPAVQKVREAAARATSINNLKQIGLAFHNHEAAYGRFPGAAIASKGGKPLLSWRVAVLPYLGQDALYKRFKLDEPWDSEHNKQLIPLMPKIYADPRLPTDVTAAGRTVYKVFVGKGTAIRLNGNLGSKIAEVTDGLSNTLLAAAGGGPVVWTKPDDLPFDPDKPLPDLRGPLPDLLVLFCDGSVRVWKDPSPDGPNRLKAAITAAGGESVVQPE